MGIILQIDRLLRDIKPTPRTSLAKQLRDVALMMKRRSIVVLISDLLTDVDDLLAGLDHLRFAGHNVVVLHTLDPHELAFPFKGTWKFNGLEGEPPLTTQPEKIRDDYLASLKTFLEAVRTGCLGSHVDYTLVDTSRPLDAVLSEFVFNRQT
jgi:uncharacterized protein (DUF58 family)